jgi:hypothetical protein
MGDVNVRGTRKTKRKIMCAVILQSSRKSCFPFKQFLLVGFTTTYVPVSINDVNSNPPHACDNVCQLLAAARWFSPISRFPPLIKLTDTI